MMQLRLRFIKEKALVPALEAARDDEVSGLFLLMSKLNTYRLSITDVN